MIALAGGTNAFSDVEGWQIITMERFITTDPEVIIVNSGTGMGEGGTDLIYRYFMDESRFKNLKAIKNNRVYIVDSDLIDRGGPRLVDALEEVAAAIHPDLFEGGPAPATTAPQSPGFGAFAASIALAAAGLILLRRVG